MKVRTIQKVNQDRYNPNLVPQLFDVVLQAFANKFNRYSEEQFVISAVAWIDYELHKAISMKIFKDPTLGDVVLNCVSLHDKINISQSLGLVSKKFRKDLHLLREIRNSIAHYSLNEDGKIVDVRFDDPSISKKIRTLVKRLSVIFAEFSEIRGKFPDGVKGDLQMILAVVIYYLDVCVLFLPKNSIEPFYRKGLRNSFIELENTLFVKRPTQRGRRIP